MPTEPRAAQRPPDGETFRRDPAKEKKTKEEKRNTSNGTEGNSDNPRTHHTTPHARHDGQSLRAASAPGRAVSSRPSEEGSGLVAAGPAGLELAVPAFEDVPVRTGVAHAAHPLNEGALRLQHDEAMAAVTWHGHGGRGKGGR